MTVAMAPTSGRKEMLWIRLASAGSSRRRRSIDTMLAKCPSGAKTPQEASSFSCGSLTRSSKRRILAQQIPVQG